MADKGQPACCSGSRCGRPPRGATDYLPVVTRSRVGQSWDGNPISETRRTFGAATLAPSPGRLTSSADMRATRPATLEGMAATAPPSLPRGVSALGSRPRAPRFRLRPPVGDRLVRDGHGSVQRATGKVCRAEARAENRLTTAASAAGCVHCADGGARARAQLDGASVCGWPRRIPTAAFRVCLGAGGPVASPGIAGVRVPLW